MGLIWAQAVNYAYVRSENSLMRRSWHFPRLNVGRKVVSEVINVMHHNWVPRSLWSQRTGYLYLRMAAMRVPQSTSSSVPRTRTVPMHLLL